MELSLCDRRNAVGNIVRERLLASGTHDRFGRPRYLPLSFAPYEGTDNGRRSMAVETLIVWLIVGAVAGWIAGLIVKGYGFGLIGNVVVGIVGAVIAGWLLPRIGIIIGGGIVAALVNAVIGAVILLVVLGLIRR
jgi:uncharacterized membrane protein YeaQ/YmgE (transglycosylase-associated protein family)